MRERWTSLQQLEDDLLEAGCNLGNFVIGYPKGRIVDDAFRLAERDGVWTIAYTERGTDAEPEFTSTDRDAACRRFYELLTSQQHWHLVGRFRKHGDAGRLEQRLLQMGLQPIRNDLPPSVLPGGAIFRVFVLGREVFAARAAFGKLPIED